MSSNLSREKRLYKLPGKHSLEHGGREPPYCLRSLKRHKISTSPQFPTSIGEIVGEFYGASNAGVTTVEPAFENLKAGPSNLPVKISPIELESVSMKPPVLQCKASSMNVEKGLLGVLEKPELHNVENHSFIHKHFSILSSSDTSSMPSVFPRKYPPPNIRKGVTIFREFQQDCGRRNLDMFSKFDVLPEGKSSKEKQFQAEKEHIRGGSSDISSEFASIAEGKTPEDVNDKVKAESEKGAQADEAELFKKVNHSEWKLNQEPGSDTITTTSSSESNSLQANSSSKMKCNNDGVQSRVESNGDDPEEYSSCKLVEMLLNTEDNSQSEAATRLRDVPRERRFTRCGGGTEVLAQGMSGQSILFVSRNKEANLHYDIVIHTNGNAARTSTSSNKSTRHRG